jgi:hypothetical protein
MGHYYYKLVRVVKEYEDGWTWKRKGLIGIEYEPHKWIYAPKDRPLGLFAFFGKGGFEEAMRRAAWHAICTGEIAEVWLVEVESPKAVPETWNDHPAARHCGAIKLTRRIAVFSWSWEDIDINYLL